MGSGAGSSAADWKKGVAAALLVQPQCLLLEALNSIKTEIKYDLLSYYGVASRSLTQTLAEMEGNCTENQCAKRGVPSIASVTLYGVKTT